MTANKTVSVWLVLPDGKVALQKRSATAKTFQNVCQATWAGKVELGEEIEDAIKRECREELGEEFYKNFNFAKLEFFGNSNFENFNKNWTCYHYVGKTSQEVLSKAKLHEGAYGEFVFADKNNLKDLVLFGDQREILEKIIYAN